MAGKVLAEEVPLQPRTHGAWGTRELRGQLVWGRVVVSKGRERGQAGGTRPRYVVLDVTATTHQ